jgi:hypothetical protein
MYLISPSHTPMTQKRNEREKLLMTVFFPYDSRSTTNRGEAEGSESPGRVDSNVLLSSDRWPSAPSSLAEEWEETDERPLEDSDSKLCWGFDAPDWADPSSEGRRELRVSGGERSGRSRHSECQLDCLLRYDTFTTPTFPPPLSDL